MELEGIVQNGVIVPDGDCPLPEGTRVTISPSTNGHRATESSLAGALLDLASDYEKQPCDLPSDLSVNHDHYLYGTPKQQP